MSLRSKIAAMVFTAIAVWIGADYLLYWRNFAPRIEEQETRLVEAELVAIEDRLSGAIDQLSSPADALRQSWNEQRAETDDGDFARQARLVQDMAGLDLVAVYDMRGRVLHHDLRDPQNGERLRLRDLPNESIHPEHPLLLHRARPEFQLGLPTGLWRTEQGIALIHTLSSGGDGFQEVQLTVGRFLSEELLAELCVTDGDELTSFLVDEDFDRPAGLVWTSNPGDHYVDSSDDQHLLAWSVLQDVTQVPVLYLRLESQRALGGLWSALQRQELLTALGLVSVFPLVLLLLLQWLVVGPLLKLASQAERIGREDDADARLESSRLDEIGRLSGAFDDMLVKLAQSREDVVRTARIAGKSEVSAALLHNVGNLLNSVTVSARLALLKLTTEDSDGFRSIFEQLEQHEGSIDDYLQHGERGRHLMPFFEALLDRTEDDLDQARLELSAAASGIEQVVELLNQVGSSDPQVSLVERVGVVRLLDAAVDSALNSQTFEAFTIERHYRADGKVHVDRHRLMDVLIGILRNAIQALEGSDQAAPCLRLTIDVLDEDYLKVEVQDNGVGIAAERLQTLFSMDFAGRGGRRGLGLHHAANLVQAMGGTLTASSEGPGKGASFTLHLPTRSEEERASKADLQQAA